VQAFNADREEFLGVLLIVVFKLTIEAPNCFFEVSGGDWVLLDPDAEHNILEGVDQIPVASSTIFHVSLR